MKQIDKMKTGILSEGIQSLRRGDGDIERLIAPRQDEITRLLARYIAEIELFNPVYGLVGTEDPRELVIKHILDSLAPMGIIYRLLANQPAPPQAAGNGCSYKVLRPGFNTFSNRPRGRGIKPLRANNGAPHIADIGSGAGLPGIPLAIVLPRINFTLIERMGRRAGFLRNTQAVLGLSNVTVEEKEMEKAAPGRFSLVTFRAFRPLEPKTLKSLFRLHSENGILAAYKGRREKIEREMAALETLCGGWEAIPCPVPMLDEARHLLVIQKRAA